MKPALLLILIVAAALQVGSHLLIPGFLQGDEVELVQDALAPLVGIDVPQWNIRNFFTSRVLVRPFAAMAWLAGARSGEMLLLAALVPFILASAANTAMVHSIAKGLATPAVAIAATAIYAFHWIPLVYGGGWFPRPFAVTAILAAYLLLQRDQSWAWSAAGLAAAVAFTVRYSEIVFVFALACLLFSERKWRICAWFAAGWLAGVVLLCGVYDWLTWGSPFSSLIAFARFTLLERGSSSAEADQPLWWYAARIADWAPMPALLFMHMAQRQAVRRLVPLILVPVGLLSLIHHKELRYLQAVIPFASVLAAVSLAAVRERRKTLAGVLLVFTVIWGVAGMRRAEKRSAAAVLTAAWLSSRTPCVATTQVWAFGHRLLLPAGMRDLPLRPSDAELRLAAEDCTVALYRNLMTDAIYETLREESCRDLGTMEFRRSRPVAVFDCTQPLK